MHVAAYVEQLGRTHIEPTVKQHLTAIRMLFDWLVTGHVMQTNPSSCGTGTEAQRSQRQDLRALCRRDARSSGRDRHQFPAWLRDRALIALMGYTFARVGAATSMKVEDFYMQKRRRWVRLHEKGGKVTELPCHHNLDQF